MTTNQAAFFGHSSEYIDLYSLQEQTIINLKLEISQNYNLLSTTIGPSMLMNKIIDIVKKTPALQTQWDNFMIMVKLASDPEDLQILEKYFGSIENDNDAA